MPSIAAPATAAARNTDYVAAAAAHAFCDYLELRVLTQNLSLLRRMLDDYFRGDGDSRTARDFVELGAMLVVVKPFDVRSRARRRQAAELLDRQRQQTAAIEAPNSPLSPVTPWRSVRERERRCSAWLLHLGALMRTHNLAWMLDMQSQFLLGQEERLRAFVRAGSAVVSFLPVKVDASGVGGASGEPGSSTRHWGSRSERRGPGLEDEEGEPASFPGA